MLHISLQNGHFPNVIGGFLATGYPFCLCLSMAAFLLATSVKSEQFALKHHQGLKN